MIFDNYQNIIKTLNKTSNKKYLDQNKFKTFSKSEKQEIQYKQKFKKPEPIHTTIYYIFTTKRLIILAYEHKIVSTSRNSLFGSRVAI